MARPKIMETRKLVSLTPELARAIEDFRFTNRISSESEAIRRLIEAGLSKAATAAPVDRGNPGGSGKSDASEDLSLASRLKKPARPPRKAETAPRSKLDQIRALREQGAG